MTDSICFKCGRQLTHTEVALHRKLVNRGATEFLCISCLSAYFKVSEEALKEKAEYFKRSGCTLFMM